MNEQRWDAERANEWYADLPWLVGCNFIPSNAINQLEMWQKETFDPETIDRELSLAASIGMNTVRVYLHDLLWKHDATGLVQRVTIFLDIAHNHGIRPAFVLLDDCWHDNPRIGPQPEPRPGIHNSGWLQSPGSAVVRDRSAWGPIKEYVQGVVSTFAHDERVLMWDLYNEPGNNYLPILSRPGWPRYVRLIARRMQQRIGSNRSLPLVKAAFEWAREVSPDQPLTTGIWIPDRSLNRYLLASCDVITFHNYRDIENTRSQIARLQEHGRPLLCTEYLARTSGNLFQTHLPLFRENNIGCYNWGLVSGKTQTIFTWFDEGGNDKEPAVWYHDIFRPDGTPFSEEETALFRSLTGRGAPG